MKRRTTIVLSEELMLRAASAARRQGLTFADLVRRGLEREIAAGGKDDPLFRRTSLPAGANPPADLAENLDAYLYGDRSSSSMPAPSSRSTTSGTATTGRRGRRSRR